MKPTSQVGKRSSSKAARSQSQTRTRAKSLGRAWQHWRPEGWKTPEKASIPEPEKGEQVTNDSRLLFYSRAHGFYFFDRLRGCTINGKPAHDALEFSTFYREALKNTANKGSLTLRFKYGPERRMVKRLSRAQAIAHCLQGNVPDRFINEVVIEPNLAVL